MAEKSNKHLPLRLVGDGRVETADGWAVGLNWFSNSEPGRHPFADANEFAPYLVRAVNCHANLVAVLKECEDFIQPFNRASDILGKIDAALARAEASS